MPPKHAPELTFIPFNEKKESKRPPMERLRELQTGAIRQNQGSEMLWAMGLDDLLDVAEQSTQDIMHRIWQQRTMETGEGESVLINSGVMSADRDFVFGGLLDIHNLIRSMLMGNYHHEGTLLYRKHVTRDSETETWDEYYAKERKFALDFANNQLEIVCPDHKQIYKALEKSLRDARKAEGKQM